MIRVTACSASTVMLWSPVNREMINNAFIGNPFRYLVIYIWENWEQSSISSDILIFLKILSKDFQHYSRAQIPYLTCVCHCWHLLVKLVYYILIRLYLLFS